MRSQRDKRLSPRRTAAIPAVITHGRGAAKCIIRNVSETGAKIEVLSVGQIPNTFRLVASGHEQHQCRVVWRTLRELGVAFI
ncbi:PilZ domain-containing protein [Mariluticola halotolerans]|uniref:PilZ domain-containing protein n=1 Tax=Mariluticola halotolerans TaxID=2909283 RepID=UPI0026E398B0|nr:PilZ domain-containing protein [Mariluticola halotolerans]UJQ95330.1 PilZ domain-containing protein [Mariluticola halotolerans]